jgi:hypothetical protein
MAGWAVGFDLVVVPALRGHVQVVLGKRAKEQVTYPAAGRIVTTM